jgi:hypothetical protein
MAKTFDPTNELGFDERVLTVLRDMLEYVHDQAAKMEARDAAFEAEIATAYASANDLLRHRGRFRPICACTRLQ